LGLGREDAEDTVNEAFIRIMRTKYQKDGKPQPCKPGKKVHPFLFTIALRIAVNILKRKRPKVFSTVFGARDDEDAIEESYMDKIAVREEPTPLQPVLAKEARETVHECLRSLEPRRTVVLAYWLETEGGCTLTDLADLLDLKTPSGASKVLQSALNDMRICLERKQVTELTVE